MDMSRLLEKLRRSPDIILPCFGLQTQILSSLFEGLLPTIEAVKTQSQPTKFIRSKDNASALDSCWKKLDRIISDAQASFFDIAPFI
jgi:hypothetical protein